MGRKLRAIDLYSGVGGWSLGLTLAGIEVVSSFERWGIANETNFKNNHHQTQTVDIRNFSFSDLPKDIDIVVGSPPCTQFSFSNRGGNGDISDGLKDIIKFLSIVEFLKPRVWAMENVPRVAGIIQKELEPGGLLEPFKHLGLNPHVVNMEEFGVPQRRRRCIAGNFDFELLKAYSAHCPQHTLGEVIAALEGESVVDPLFGVTLPQKQLTEQMPEAPLNVEEVRINRASKLTHTVYNAMPFPDPLDRSVRTITATCTRVSRESIVIEPPSFPGTYRRLTIRERACLQGFPITFQFYGSTFGQKLKMVGNAVPPAFAYLMGHVFAGTEAGNLPALSSHADKMRAPEPMPLETSADRPGATYPWHRTFRFAIPSLHLKSGVRFELRNVIIGAEVAWRVAFYFGTPKQILELPLDGEMEDIVRAAMQEAEHTQASNLADQLCQHIRTADIAGMQRVWTHRGVGGLSAFMLLDEIDAIGREVINAFKAHEQAASAIVRSALDYFFPCSANLPGASKLERNAPVIAAGLLLGSLTNRELTRQLTSQQLPKDKKKAA